jgi:hypothetical protein
MDQSEALTGTVTKLLKQLHTGDEVVVQQIFDYYFWHQATPVFLMKKILLHW